MRTVLYYFSGTGNSLAVARDIAAGLGGAELVPAVKGLRDGVGTGADAIGVVFPVYIWGMPLPVADLIGKFKPGDAGYFFAVCTYGGFPAGTMLCAQKAFRNGGIEMSAGFGVRMPGNYTPMYGAISADKQNKMFAEGKLKAKEIAKAVAKRKVMTPEKNAFPVNFLFTDIIYGFSAKHIPAMDSKFFADQKCNGCGICVKVCQAGNIELKGGRPSWGHKCFQCMACLQWCPAEAVQYGKSTFGRRRYRHPEVKAEDFMIG